MPNFKTPIDDLQTYRLKEQVKYIQRQLDVQRQAAIMAALKKYAAAAV